jgi:regulator of cell morphogenesis and NO signaling
MKEVERTMTIGEIVANDFRAASVFKDAGIDFCCGGKKTLEAACAEKGVDQDSLKEKLNNLEETHDNASANNFNEWDPGFLCDYIVNTHHNYIRKSLPDLLFYTKKIAGVHGANHPELAEVSQLVIQINDELTGHLQKEEKVLFPAVKELFNKGPENVRELLTSELATLSGEHESAGGAMDRINTITDGYKLPADACNSYRLTFDLLEKFEDDLHTHVHLENNILFPKIINTIN